MGVALKVFSNQNFAQTFVDLIRLSKLLMAVQHVLQKHYLRFFSLVILDIMEAMMLYGNKFYKIILENYIVMNKIKKVHSLVQNKSYFEFNQTS